MKNTKTIKFNQDCMYDGVLSHRKGDITELDDTLGYATRWLVYGMAEIYVAPIVEEVKSNKLTQQEEEVLHNFIDKIGEEQVVEQVEQIAKEEKIVETRKSKNKLKSL
jgi:mevalonate kinase